MAIPMKGRQGGLLLAVPSGYFLPHAIADAMAHDDSEMLGPNKEFICNLLEEEEDGTEVILDDQVPCLLMDFSDQVLELIREYDPVMDPSESIQTFSPLHPVAIAHLIPRRLRSCSGSRKKE